MENKKITSYAILIAVYVAISMLLSNLSFGMIQIRIAEVLLILCFYDKRYIIPITLGCFLTNLIGIISGVNIMVLDLLAGTFATFLSGVLMNKLRNIKYKNLPIIGLMLPPIINGIMVGFELHLYFKISYFILFCYVALGEFISVTILGALLYKPIGATIRKYVE